MVDDSWEKIGVIAGFDILKRVGKNQWSSSAEKPEDIAMISNYMVEEGFFPDDEDWEYCCL